MESKNCTKGDTKKSIKNFDRRYLECRGCSSESVLKQYYVNKGKILQQPKYQYVDFKDLLKTYVELENRLKALEEKADNKSS